MPDQYGAAADGVTDDTAAIQNAVNSARDAGGGVITLSPSGTYILTRIILYPGITMELNGATCKRPANQPNGTRMFTSGDPAAGFPTYSGATDSRPVTIRNGILDGNRANQGAYQNYEQEQSHLIFMYATPMPHSRGGFGSTWRTWCCVTPWRTGSPSRPTWTRRSPTSARGTAGGAE